MIERLDDHIFELFAHELLDRAFILFLHLGVIGQQSDGMETARLAVASRIGIRVEKLLYGVRRVGALAQNLLDRRVPGAFGRKCFAGQLQLLRGFLLRTAKRDQAGLRVASGGTEFLGAALCLRVEVFFGLHTERQCAPFHTQGTRGLGSLLLRCGVACRGFFRLERLGLQARRFFHQAPGKLAQSSYPRFERFLLTGAAPDLLGGFAQSGFERRALFAQRRHGFALRVHPREKLGSLPFGLLDFERDAGGTRI